MLEFNVLLLSAAVLSLLLLSRSPPTRQRFRRCIEIDTRSLAVFRVLLGVLIAADVVSRLRNFHYFYTDAGVVPRELALAVLPEHAFSVFLLSGNQYLALALFAAHFAVALQLVVGYRTRLATVLSFLLAVSLDYRNPLVLSYADTLFALLLFWATFLPLGERWSIDAMRSGREPEPSVAGLASFLVLLQAVSMYFVNATHKAESELWRSGEALVVVVGLDDMTFLFGDLLRTFPDLLQFGGLAWYYMVWFSPLLLLLVGRSRATYAGLFVVAHLLLAVTVRIGAFSFVSVAALVLFFQSRAWEDAAELSASVGASTSEVGSRLSAIGSRVGQVLPDASFDWPTDSDLPREAVRVLVVVVLLVSGASMAVENLQSAGIVHESHDFVLEDLVAPANEMLRIEQPSWTIFAPNPRDRDYYYVFPAETTTGGRLDVYNDRPLTYDRPYRALNRQYPTYRHRFYMNSVRRSALHGGYSGAHRYLAEYYCDTWEGSDGAQLRFVSMYAVGETVTPSTIDAPSERDRGVTLLYRHSCVEGEPARPIQPPPEDFER